MKKVWETVKNWLPLACAITGLCLLVYVVGQQEYRQTLNDPQIQMAQDAARDLNGKTFDVMGFANQAQKWWNVNYDALPNSAVDIEQSLTPFLNIYDAQGKRVYGNGYLGTDAPMPPRGVLEAAKKNGENRLTWEPKNGVRIAAIVVHYLHDEGQDGYVIAGRNMREGEDRISLLGDFVLLAWIVIMGASLITAYVVRFL